MRHIISIALMLATVHAHGQTMDEKFTTWEYQSGRTQTPMLVTWNEGRTEILHLDVAGLSSEDAIAEVDAITQGEVDSAAVAIINDKNDAKHGAGSSGVRDTAASNIVALSSAYGVTDQPISWADVATAMQVERIDATASNDVMRLLTVIGDGTTLLSFKEFYSENGGDVFNVRWP
jgi:hypothetical protein